MPASKISALPVASALTGTELLPVVQGGTTKQTTVSGVTSLVASKTQTNEFMGVIIEVADDKDYKILVKAPHGGTITEVTTICVSGTATLQVKINTTALGGTANSVSSSEQSQAHSSANVFVAGDDIVITISSNAACEDLSATIKYTRVLS